MLDFGITAGEMSKIYAVEYGNVAVVFDKQEDEYDSVRVLVAFCNQTECKWVLDFGITAGEMSKIYAVEYGKILAMLHLGKTFSHSKNVVLLGNNQFVNSHNLAVANNY